MSRSEPAVEAGAGLVLYGIKNCDTVKRARVWFADQGAELRFHDFKASGVPADRLQFWLASAGRERLLNRKGTTWRNLAAEEQLAVVDRVSARALMEAQTSVIKRPVVDWGDGKFTVGFDPQAWEKRL